MVKKLFLGLLICLLVAACRQAGQAPLRPVRVFCAAGFAPVLESIREDCRRDLGIDLLMESSGSEVACRKLTGLGRPCDLLLLADGDLVARLLRGYCSWRIDFATDEIVLGVGTRAPGVSEAEKNWVPVLLRENVRLARADENLAPVGYRTLLVWALQEQLGNPALSDRLKSKCRSVVDDVEQLAILLKTGEMDYAFLYRSTCMTHSIRSITLDKQINLGAVDVDYSMASVAFTRLKSGARQKGAPCTWTITMPDQCADRESALQLLRYLLTRQRDLLARDGFTPIVPPRFFGDKTAWRSLAGGVEYSGPLFPE